MSNDMQIGIMNGEAERLQGKKTVTYSEVGPYIFVAYSASLLDAFNGVFEL